MISRLTEVLKDLDLTPRSPVLPGGRSIIGGTLFLLYIPLLLLYLIYNIAPLYGSLPNCCACATSDTPDDSFIYQGLNDTCSLDINCKTNVSSLLTEYCVSAVDYNPPPLDNVIMDLALIICAGTNEGSPCKQKCFEVSNKWLNALDYTYQLNRDQAITRCDLGVGICDFRAVSATDEKFPQSLCRYPSISSILIKLGAGLGLVNGLVVTLRMLIRAVWVRVAEKNEDDGKPRDYAIGALSGLILNYFAITYFLVSSSTTKRMRYGSQMVIGLLFIFLRTPLVINLVYLLGQFWAPMMIYSVVSAVAYLILFRTIYCTLRLETRSRETDRGAFDYEELLAKHVRRQGKSSLIESVNLLNESLPPDQLYPHSLWRNFMLGILGNILAFPYIMLKMSWHDRNSGYFAGSMCGTSLMMLFAVWTFMYSKMLWPFILFDFPFPIDYPTPTVYLQSAYFTYTTIWALLFVYFLCSFLKAQREKDDVMPIGTKAQYRMAFILASVPVFVVLCVFLFGIFLPYTDMPLPTSTQKCNFPIIKVFIPFLGIIPGFLVFLASKVSRIRWGAFSACGFSFLALSVLLNIFVFQYCLGSGPHRRPFYPFVCVSEMIGSFIVIYGAIRPNKAKHITAESPLVN